METDDAMYDSVHFECKLDPPEIDEDDYSMPTHYDGCTNNTFEGHETPPPRLLQTLDFSIDADEDLMSKPIIHCDGDIASYFQDDKAPEQLSPTFSFGTGDDEDSDDNEASLQLQNPTPDLGRNKDGGEFNATPCEKFQAIEKYQHNGVGVPHSASQNMDLQEPPITCDIKPQHQVCNNGTSSSEWQYIADLLSDKPGPSISLEQWVKIERGRSSSLNQKNSTLRKLAIVYGLCKLLESPGIRTDHCAINNFAVREPNQESDADSSSGRNFVADVVMIEPSLSVHLVTTQLSPNGSTEEPHDDGEVLATVMDNVAGSTSEERKDTSRDERGLCCALGRLMLAVFSKEKTPDAKPDITSSANHTVFAQPTKKQSRETSFAQASISVPKPICGADEIDRQHESLEFTTSILNECDSPPSILQLIRDLLSCGDGLFCPDSAFRCIADVVDELHLLLKEPRRFLFERVFAPQLGRHLSFSNEKLFGRSCEINEITSAYHRVASTGVSECVIVGGESG